MPHSRRRLGAARAYCVRVLTDVVRPPGVLTVVVQLLKTAMIRIAPSAGMMSLRIGWVWFPFDSENRRELSVSAARLCRFR